MKINLEDVIGIRFSEAALIQILQVILVILVGIIGIRIVITLLRKGLKKSSLDPVEYVLVIRMVRIILWILLILTVLSFLKVDLSPYVAVLASAGAAVALALKDSLSNVAGGLILFFTKPFLKGDEIQVDEVSGIVDYIDILTTKLHTTDNKVVIIPNGKIVTSILINYSRRDIRRIDCKFLVDFSSDVDLAKRSIREVIEKGPYFLKEPEPSLGVSELDGRTVVIDALVWVKTEDRWDAKYYMEEEVKKAFERNGVDIPLEKLNVHVVEKNNNV